MIELQIIIAALGIGIPISYRLGFTALHSVIFCIGLQALFTVIQGKL